MSHNSGGVTNLQEIFVFEYEESAPCDDEGGVGGLNYTSYLVKPLVIMSLSIESRVTSAMNPKP
jgi:hypothetical protein